MAKHGKKYRAAFERVDRAKRYSFQEAVQLALATHYTKNDQGLDIAVRLGVDPRHADQMVRGSVVLPHGLGKTVRVLVFAKGEKEKEALDAGADLVGNVAEDRLNDGRSQVENRHDEAYLEVVQIQSFFELWKNDRQNPL